MICEKGGPMAFAQLRQTPEYKAVASHEIRRAAFVEGVRLAVRGEPLGAWRKQHPWQRYVHKWAVEGHATACRLYGLPIAVGVDHNSRTSG
jgi:GH43 family beta-xylosidase